MSGAEELIVDVTRVASVQGDALTVIEGRVSEQTRLESASV